VHETADDVEDVVGVHGGEHQVAGEGRLDGDLGGVRVADLAHHDLVRVVAQDGAQAPGEGEALLLVHRDLQHAGQLVFHRVLDGDDLVLAGVDLGQGGIQGGGLARAGGAGHQEHAVGLGGQAPHPGQGVAVEAQALQGDALELVGQLLPVQHAQHAILAEHPGHDGHPQVDLPAAQVDLEAAVLGHAPLGDVQLGHDLDAGDDLLGHFPAGRVGHMGQHAIDAVLDGQPRGIVFQVDVRSPRGEGVVQGGMAELDHRRGIRADGLEGDFLHRLAAAGLPGHGAHPVHGLEAGFQAVQPGQDVLAQGQGGSEGRPDALLGPGVQMGIQGVGEHEPDSPPRIPAGHAFLVQGQAEGDQVEGGLQFPQAGHVQGGVGEGLRQPGEKISRCQAQALLQGRQGRHPEPGGLLPGQGQPGGVDGVAGSAHSRLPASSKMGR
jgi:hypothetical protein